MEIDWEALGRQVGSIGGASGEVGGTAYAQAALEALLGDDGIDGAIERFISGKPGHELAMNVLRLLGSRKAAERAYSIYKNDGGERGRLAVWLIKLSAHPIAFEWIPEFLADHEVAISGAGLLDQLLWSRRVATEDAESLIVLCEQHPIENVRETAAFIRGYLKDRTDVIE